MASFGGRQRAAPAWSVDDASTFAAQKEFKLLQLLSTDKKALATARRLGFFSQQPQPQGRASAAQAGSAASCPPGAGAAPASAGPNARKRKSAARSAKRHASRRARNRWNRCLTAVLCMVRLRLCVRRRVLEQDLREVGTLCDRSRSGSGQLVAQPVGMTGAKRLDRPASSSSHGSSHEEPANFDYQYQAVGRMPYPLPHGWLWCVDPASGSSYYVNEGLKLWQWVHQPVVEPMPEPGVAM